MRSKIYLQIAVFRISDQIPTPTSLALSRHTYMYLLSNLLSCRRLCSCFIMWDATIGSTSISLCTCSRSAANPAFIAVTSFSAHESFTNFSSDKNGVHTVHVRGAAYPSGLLLRLGQCALWTDGVPTFLEQVILRLQPDISKAPLYC